nr:transposase domain-containing protein [Leucothrix pacifica]
MQLKTPSAPSLSGHSQRGATASANLYSLIETAKANHREPYHYLS